jgi:hypothetical protein
VSELTLAIGLPTYFSSSLNTNTSASDEALQQWISSRTGLMTDAGLSTSTYYRLRPDSPVLRNHHDPSAGPNTPHFAFLMNVSCPWMLHRLITFNYDVSLMDISPHHPIPLLRSGWNYLNRCPVGSTHSSKGSSLLKYRQVDL